MSDEWGPWIEHDGKGCPCRGAWVQSEERCGVVEEHIAGGVNRGAPFCAWDWGGPFPQWEIVRYRIRKPRGLTILENLIADLPAPVGPQVDA